MIIFSIIYRIIYKYDSIYTFAIGMLTAYCFMTIIYLFLSIIFSHVSNANITSFDNSLAIREKVLLIVFLTFIFILGFCTIFIYILDLILNYFVLQILYTVSLILSIVLLFILGVILFITALILYFKIGFNSKSTDFFKLKVNFDF